MTDYLVRLSVHSPGAPASGWVPADEVAVIGSISCRPYAPDINAARVHAEGPDRIILPEPFTVKLVNGECTLHLRPTDAWWCWEVREQTKGGRIRHLSVADSALVLDYADAIDVDPITLTPAAAAVPAWTAAVDAVQGYANAAAGSAGDALASAGLSDGYADAAGISAGAAAQSASDANVSAGAAAGSAGAASGSAGAAAGSAGAASGSAGAAAGSAGAASGSAGAAAGSAGAASGSADAAAGSAGAASSSAAAALVSKNAAGVSEGNAAGSAAAAAATLAGAVPKSLVDAKGDLLAGSANDTIARLPVGSTGALLTPDSGAASGLRWTTRLTLEGSGSPLGVVSAPVGSVYYDTAGTCGAWVWLKTSGTGSTGWVVTVGDTGWRLVALDNGWSGTLKVKRVGNMVHWNVSGLTGRATWAPLLEVIPAGFTPTANCFAMLRENSLGGTLRLAITDVPLGMASGQSALLSGTWNSATLTTLGTFSHETQTAWPTSLPGSPA